jgi:hypothetical protein
MLLYVISKPNMGQIQIPKKQLSNAENQDQTKVKE